MEKITSFELLNALKRNIKTILISTIVLAVLGFSYSKFVKDESYKAQTVMIVVGDDDQEITYNKLLLNEKLANIYSQIIESEDIYKDVIKKLGLKNIKPVELKDSIETEVNAQAGIITFEYTDTNRDKAIDTLTAVCEDFKAYVKEYLKVDNLSYLQKVTAPDTGKQEIVKYTGLGAGFGLILSLLFVSLREVTSQKIKGEDYIRDLEIEILGVIDEK